MNWNKVLKTEGCWLWMGALNSDGYGNAWDKYIWVCKKAHRLAYEELVGRIQEGLELDHLCGVRNCVNPNHLEPVTHEENVRRGRGAPGCMNGSALHNAQKSHCKWGHPLSGDNLYVVRPYPNRPNGARQCQTCRRRRDLERGLATIRPELERGQ